MLTSQKRPIKMTRTRRWKLSQWFSQSQNVGQELSRDRDTFLVFLSYYQHQTAAPEMSFSRKDMSTHFDPWVWFFFSQCLKCNSKRECTLAANTMPVSWQWSTGAVTFSTGPLWDATRGRGPRRWWWTSKNAQILMSPLSHSSPVCMSLKMIWISYCIYWFCVYVHGGGRVHATADMKSEDKF